MAKSKQKKSMKIHICINLYKTQLPHATHNAKNKIIISIITLGKQIYDSGLQITENTAFG